MINLVTIIPVFSDFKALLQALTLYHDSTIRTKERNELMKNYQKLINEKKF